MASNKGKSRKNTGATVVHDTGSPHTHFGDIGGGYMGDKEKYKKYLDQADPPPKKKKKK